MLKKVLRNFIWDALHDLVPFVQFKNVNSTHGGVFLLEKLQVKPATLLKATFLRECFSSFLNCPNSTKPRKASHMQNYVPPYSKFGKTL